MEDAATLWLLNTEKRQNVPAQTGKGFNAVLLSSLGDSGQARQNFASVDISCGFNRWMQQIVAKYLQPDFGSCKYSLGARLIFLPLHSASIESRPEVRFPSGNAASLPWSE